MELSVEQESAISSEILVMGYSGSLISESFLIIVEDSFLIGRRIEILEDSLMESTGSNLMSVK